VLDQNDRGYAPFDKRTAVSVIVVIFLALITTAWTALSVTSPQRPIDNHIADHATQQPAAASAIPAGTIIAWYAKNKPIPPGWAICNGTNGTPDLRDRFLRGTGDPANIGKTGGANQHHHTVTTTVPEGEWKGSDWHWGETPWRAGPNPVKGGTSATATTSDAENLPPFTEVIFLMKR
jgi:hypothetical protein